MYSIIAGDACRWRHFLSVAGSGGKDSFASFLFNSSSSTYITAGSNPCIIGSSSAGVSVADVSVADESVADMSVVGYSIRSCS